MLNNYSPVPGMEDWHKGEKNGSVGWFPKAYVERVDGPSTDLFGCAAFLCYILAMFSFSNLRDL